MSEKMKIRATLAEVQNMKGKAQWAKLVAEEKNTNKKVQPTKKRAADFGASYTSQQFKCKES